VFAYNGAGDSAYSNTDSARTQAGTPSSYTLNVLKSGVGAGTVTASGINCGADCTETYNSGTGVTLSATAASGSTFTGWTGCDSASGSTCTVSMDADRSVTATFGLSYNGSITLSLPATDADGNYTLSWTISAMFVSTTSLIQEDSNTSFSSPTTYYVYYGARSKYFTGKADGTYCYRVSNYWQNAFSEPACITVARPTSGTLRIENNTAYPMVDIRLNGVQQVYSPYYIAQGNYYDFVRSPGYVNVNAGLGYYNSNGTRDIWFTCNGSATISAGLRSTLTCNNPTIGQLLTGFNTGGRYWTGEYFEGTVMHMAKYFFGYNGSWRFYRDNVLQTASGNATLVSWPDNAVYVYFKLCPSCANIQASYPFAMFFYKDPNVGGKTVWYTLQ
jgi:hypothetical protein